MSGLRKCYSHLVGHSFPARKYIWFFFWLRMLTIASSSMSGHIVSITSLLTVAALIRSLIVNSKENEVD